MTSESPSCVSLAKILRRLQTTSRPRMCSRDTPKRGRQRSTSKVGWMHDLPDQCRDPQRTWHDCNLVFELTYFLEAYSKGSSAHEEPTTPTHQERENSKSEIREKNLTQAEQQLFYEAKCKELRSFFECGVWEFTTSNKADADRTLSSRMLLKCAKNSDGTPRAKARLVVRGYNDADALAGVLDTQSPTASRLARNLLPSISAML